MANVLIVDDDEMVRLAEGRIIEQAGHTPIFAGDGEAGMQMYQEPVRLAPGCRASLGGVPGGAGGSVARVGRPSTGWLGATEPWTATPRFV